MKRLRNRSLSPLRVRNLALALSLAAARAVAADDGGPVFVADSDDGGSDWTNGDSLYLEVSLNGVDSGKIAHFDRRADGLYATPTTLERLGLRLATSDSATPVRIDGLAGVRAEFDGERQRVAIVAPVAMLEGDIAQLNGNSRSSVASAASAGALLNYDLYGTHADGSSGLNAAAELRLFGFAGIASTGVQSQLAQDGTGDWRTRTVRLGSDWTFAFPEHMLNLSFGDFQSGNLAWSRSAYIGGLRLARDFSQQPYRLTMPLPAFVGEAVAPSAVDLYVNGMKQYSGQVTPGRFQINALPVVSGVGQAQVVLTDAFGRATTIDFPFYSTDQLLQRGLSDYSLELGFVRRGYGQRSFDYAAAPMASGTLRYGVSDRLTVEGHAEADSRTRNGGAGANLLLGDAGLLAAAVAASDGAQGSGHLVRLGYSWRGYPFSFAVDATRTFDDYTDVAARYGRAPPRISARASAGYSFGKASLSASLIHLRYPGEEATRYAGLNYSHGFGALSLNLGLNQNLDRSEDRNLFVGFTYQFERTTVAATATRDRQRSYATVDVAQPIPGDGGFGWRAQTQQGEGVHAGYAEAGYRASWGQLLAGASSYDGNTLGYASLDGALVLLGGHAFAARRIDDAFAVVTTDGVAGVPVKLENRTIGVTDGSGALLVTPLNAWQDNQLAIDPMDLPADRRIDRVNAIASPPRGAGTVVRFGITPLRAASLRLVDAAGTPLAAGSAAQLQSGAGTIVGYDGETYLEGLGDHNRLRVELADGACTVEFDLPPTSTGIPLLGPLTCRKESR